MALICIYVFCYIHSGVEPTFRSVSFWTNIYYEIRVTPIKSFRGEKPSPTSSKIIFSQLNRSLNGVQVFFLQ